MTKCFVLFAIDVCFALFSIVVHMFRFNISQFAIVFACWNRARCFDELFRSFALFDQHMFWNIFYQNVQSKIVYMNDVLFYNFIRFTIFSYWFWNAFHQNVRSKIVLHERRFFFLCETYKYLFFCVNANVIYQK